MNISVVIPVYKKHEMLMRHLRHNMPYLKGYEIIIVDDASDENISERVHTEFPEIKVLVNQRNMGFAPTVNRGIDEAKGDYILLLNSDVKLISPFNPTDFEMFQKDPTLFAISFMQKERDGKYVGKNRMFFSDGFPSHSKSSNLDEGINGWAEGGSSIIRTDYLRDLGGLLNIYAPFYWEDNDLSYRAYSRGLHVLFSPKIIVEHHHESTVGSFYTKEQVTRIAYRNQFIFTWINITESTLFLAHLLRLPMHVAKALFRHNTQFLGGLIDALTRIGLVYRHRKQKRIHQKITDSQIFERA